MIINNEQQQIDKTLVVKKSLNIGSRLSVSKDAVIGGNLKVDGWLDAKNIKGVNKGLFANADALLNAYPNPPSKQGWWACVIDIDNNHNKIITVYDVVDGEWHNTNVVYQHLVVDDRIETVSGELNDLTERFSGVENGIGQHEDRLGNLESTTAGHTSNLADVWEQIVQIGSWHTEDIQRFERDEVAMAGLDARFNTMLQTNDTDALDSFQEIVTFLNGISKNESLSRIVSSLRQRIDSAYNRLYSLASPLTTVKIDNDSTSIAITINHSALNLVSMSGKQKSIPLGETRTWTILNGQSLWADPENNNIVVRTEYVSQYPTPLILLADNEGGSVRNGLFANVPQPTYTGKSWCAIGDSITEADDSSWYPYRGYQTFVKKKLGFAACYNRGIGGQTAKSYAQLIEANHPQANIPVADIYTIAFGINDWSNSNSGRTPAGGINDYLADNPDVETTAGALRKIIDHVYSKNPQAKVILMTPCKAEGRGDNPGGLPPTWNTANTNGDYLADYADVIKGIGVAMSIPVVDLFGNALLNAKTLGNWTLDFLHPNEAGHQLIANALVDKLNNVL